MSTQTVLPEGASWLTPYLTVSDAKASLDFYERAFGFENSQALHDPNGTVVHAEMRYQGVVIVMFAPEGAWGGITKTPAHSGVTSATGLYVYCEDVDTFTAQAIAAGAQLICSPQDMFWGDRIAGFCDLDGHNWTFAQPIGEFDPDKVPWTEIWPAEQPAAND
jgi:uncharacterized glyoxalase superfamily protein PhnB